MSEATPTKPELIAQMDAGLSELLAALDQLSNKQFLEITDDAGWNVRDHVAHLSVWAAGIAALLRREDRWATMGIPEPSEGGDEEHYQRINAAIVAQHRHLSPAQARAQLVAAHQNLIAAVDMRSDSDLDQPYDYYVAPFTGTTGNPIRDYVIGNSHHHYVEHLPWIQAIVAV